MASDKKLPPWLTWLGIALLQYIAAQVFTFLIYLLVGLLFAADMGNFPLTRPILFIVLLGATFTVGVFLVGWLGLRLGWLTGKSGIVLRLIAALVGAYLPLVLGLFLIHPLVPGHPIYNFSILSCIVGFHMPGLVGKK
jgi:hypothetical protein